MELSNNNIRKEYDLYRPITPYELAIIEEIKENRLKQINSQADEISYEEIDWFFTTPCTSTFCIEV